MMQGVIMGLGVVILLGLALTQVGGLSNATQELSRQVPPRDGNATLVRTESASSLVLAKGTWLEMPAEEKRQPFVRLKEVVEFSKGQTEFAGVPVIEVRTSVENATELKSIRAQVKDVGVCAHSPWMWKAINTATTSRGYTSARRDQSPAAPQGFCLSCWQ